MEDPTQFKLLTECSGNSEEPEVSSGWLLQENVAEEGVETRLHLLYNIWLSFTHVYKGVKFPWEQKSNKNRIITRTKSAQIMQMGKQYQASLLELLSSWGMTQLVNDLDQSAAYLQCPARSPCA